jgi:hypothetical protein
MVVDRIRPEISANSFGLLGGVRREGIRSIAGVLGAVDVNMCLVHQTKWLMSIGRPIQI